VLRVQATVTVPPTGVAVGPVRRIGIYKTPASSLGLEEGAVAVSLFASPEGRPEAAVAGLALSSTSDLELGLVVSI